MPKGRVGRAATVARPIDPITAQLQELQCLAMDGRLGELERRGKALLQDNPAELRIIQFCMYNIPSLKRTAYEDLMTVLLVEGKAYEIPSETSAFEDLYDETWKRYVDFVEAHFEQALPLLLKMMHYNQTLAPKAVELALAKLPHASECDLEQIIKEG